MRIPQDGKAMLRKRAEAARKVAHEAGGSAGDALCGGFCTGFVLDEPRVISGYAPIRSEIDPMPLMRALAAAGHRLCLPVIEAAGRPLAFRAWAAGAAMEQGPFGAAIPTDGAWLEPQVLLVPLLAFDRRGFRLGYGGGFYDRTLECLRGRGAVMAVGLAYAAQEVARVPTEPTDQRLDAILTEAGLIHPESDEAT